MPRKRRRSAASLTSFKGRKGRWGDYSDLTVDPAEDCTFFYTTEYLAEDTVVIGTWRTRVVSFRFPGCK